MKAIVQNHIKWQSQTPYLCGRSLSKSALKESVSYQTYKDLLALPKVLHSPGRSISGDRGASRSAAKGRGREVLEELRPGGVRVFLSPFFPFL
jgi:hypothetical protein